jgi:thioredoxin reductase
MPASLPVVIIGAGPVGLAAAAHVQARGMTPLVLEAGDAVGAGMRTWAHVRMFSPWKFNIDSVSAALLERHGWVMPAPETCPTGRDMIDRYLAPLSRTPELAGAVRLNSRVTGVARQRLDLMKDQGRDGAPFVVRIATPDGDGDIVAGAVIDASGTIEHPGSAGASGLPAAGERAAAERIFYGIPDVLGAHRVRYAGRRVLVVGSGHSAMNALLDLADLMDVAPATRVVWAVRRPSLDRLLGPRQDQLEGRGRLGDRVRALVAGGRFGVATGFHLERLAPSADGLVASDDGRTLSPVDEVIAATGFRPDWSILSEVRLDLDPAVQAPRALAPLIDPNVHSCGTVPPHGAEALRHPDADVYAIGMKSYGRAPTFLLLTGYEQARSVVAAIADDWDAARRVELVLPETGVCSTDVACCTSTACC